MNSKDVHIILRGMPPMLTSFSLTPLLCTSSISRKVELFASTFRLSRWLHGKAHASALEDITSEFSQQLEVLDGCHLASICAERVHASRMSTTVPKNSSSAISRKRTSRFSSVSVLESANDLQHQGIDHILVT